MAQRTLKSEVFGGTYLFGQKLGEGAQAAVYLVDNIHNGECKRKLACKQTNMSYLQNIPAARQKSRWDNMVRELVILELLDSPHVIKVHEFIRTKNNFYMV